MRQRFCIGEIVRGDKLNFRITESGADDISSDTAEAVNTYSDWHIPLFYGGIPSELPARVVWRLARRRQRRCGCAAHVGVTLLDANDFAFIEADKRHSSGGLAIHPIFDFIAIGVRLAALVTRLAEREQNLIAIHAVDGALLFDCLSDRFGERVHVLLCRGVLFEIEDRRQHLADLNGLQRGYAARKYERHMRAVRGLSVLISGDRRHAPVHTSTHADLDVVIPVAGFSATVNFKNNFVRFDLDACDLNLIAEPRGGSVFLQRPVPGVPVKGAVTAYHQGMLRAREDDFGGGKFSREAAFDFEALVETQFVGAERGRERKS